MPNLPTLSVTNTDTWDRLMAAFNESATDYKTWLREAVRAEVESRELQALQEAAQSTLQARRAELSGFLDDAV